MQGGPLQVAWRELGMALAFLTILPIRPADGVRPGRGFAWFPLVGLVVGGGAALVGLIPAPSMVRAFLVLAAWIAISGALHLDGLADAADGLLSTTTPERRLEIMKDPRAGSWAVVAIAVLLIGKFAAIESAGGAVLIAAAVGGRWAMVIAAERFPYARTTGMGGYFRDGLGRPQLLLATLIAMTLIGALIFVDVRALVALAAPLVAIGAGGWASGRLGGGLTGDVYGAICEVTELLIVTGAALWAG